MHVSAYKGRNLILRQTNGRTDRWREKFTFLVAPLQLKRLLKLIMTKNYRSRVGELIVQFEKFLSTHYSVGAKQAAREQISKYSSSGVTRVNDSAV